MRTRVTTRVEASGTGKYEALLARCAGLGPIATAVGYPCDTASLGAVVEAADAGIIAPILVGPAARIQRAAKDAGLDIGPYALEDARDAHAAAARAVEIVRLGRAQVLMKGSLHTDELM